MLFSSLHYFIFLPIVYIVFYLTIDKFRWLVLLLGSIFFYGFFKSTYLLSALAIVTIATYYCGILIDRCIDTHKKKNLLCLGITANLLVLVSLKYLPSLSRILDELFKVLLVGINIPASPILVSIGVSYFVFQAISYLIDIYLGIEKPELHFGYFALYLGFFPKLLQGPIERAGDLLPQLTKKYEFDYDNMRSGMLLFTWGLFKKVAVSDRLALFVNTAYDDVHSYSGLSLIIATYLYAIQLYCDFSGYTDMALGTARMFNINLTQNFNAPFLATSIADFWRRWHISFSRWILDYIFKPLQMKLRDWKTWGTASALLITFLVSGIWHGATWGFVIWGALHGVYLASSVILKPYQKKIYKRFGIGKSLSLQFWQIVVTTNLVCFAWIFFRSDTISDAYYIVTHLFIGSKGLDKLLFGRTNIELYAAGFALLLLFFVGGGITLHKQSKNIFQYPVWVRWPSYFLLVMSIVMLYVDSDRAFIYFQF